MNRACQPRGGRHLSTSPTSGCVILEFCPESRVFVLKFELNWKGEFIAVHHFTDNFFLHSLIW